MLQADDCTVKLERDHDLPRDLLVCWLINTEELIPVLYRNKVSYLISETYGLEHHTIYLTHLHEPLVNEPLTAGFVLGIPKP